MLRHRGWMDLLKRSKLERKPKLTFPNGRREVIVPWIKGCTAGPLGHYSQSDTRFQELMSHSEVGRLWNCTGLPEEFLLWVVVS